MWRRQQAANPRIHERNDSFKAGQTSWERRFDWPAFLEMRKQARQSASSSNLYGEAPNARNRIATSLRHPLHPCDSVPLTDSVPGAQCVQPSAKPCRSLTGRIFPSLHGFAFTMQTVNTFAPFPHQPNHWRRFKSYIRRNRFYSNSGSILSQWFCIRYGCLQG